MTLTATDMQTWIIQLDIKISQSKAGLKIHVIATFFTKVLCIHYSLTTI